MNLHIDARRELTAMTDEELLATLADVARRRQNRSPSYSWATDPRAVAQAQSPGGSGGRVVDPSGFQRPGVVAPRLGEGLGVAAPGLDSPATRALSLATAGGPVRRPAPGPSAPRRGGRPEHRHRRSWKQRADRGATGVLYAALFVAAVVVLVLIAYGVGLALVPH